MTDRHFSVGCAAACGLWLAVAVLLAVGTVRGDIRFGIYGLACSAAAATATIRQFHVVTNHMLRNAFELGRDAASIEQVRRLY